MILLVLSGVLAVLAVLVLPIGRSVLKKRKAKKLEEIKTETRGEGDPARSSQALDGYAVGISVVELISVVLLAAGVLCQTVDTLQERTMADKKLDPTVEQLAKLVQDGAVMQQSMGTLAQKISAADARLTSLNELLIKLDERVRKLESPPKGGGGGTGKPPGGDGPGDPKKPKGPTPGGARVATEDAQEHTKSLLLRVGKLEEEMSVRNLPLSVPEVPVG
jgi:hypothetical protein